MVRCNAKAVSTSSPDGSVLLPAEGLQCAHICHRASASHGCASANPRSCVCILASPNECVICDKVLSGANPPTCVGGEPQGRRGNWRTRSLLPSPKTLLELLRCLTVRAWHRQCSECSCLSCAAPPSALQLLGGCGCSCSGGCRELRQGLRLRLCPVWATLVLVLVLEEQRGLLMVVPCGAESFSPEQLSSWREVEGSPGEV